MEYNYVITHEKIREWKKENFGVEFDKIRKRPKTDLVI